MMFSGILNRVKFNCVICFSNGKNVEWPARGDKNCHNEARLSILYCPYNSHALLIPA
jgi:hypothetical protein